MGKRFGLYKKAQEGVRGWNLKLLWKTYIANPFLRAACVHNPGFAVDSLADTDFDKAVKEGQAVGLGGWKFSGEAFRYQFTTKKFLGLFWWR